MLDEFAGIEERWRLRGQKADDAMKAGAYDEAIALHASLLKDIEDSGQVDTLPVSKSVLSQLICYVMKGDLESAHALWTQNIEVDQTLQALGVYAIETGRIDVHDLVVYFMVCARIHSFAGSNLPEALEAINSYMSRVCQYGSEDDPSLLPLAMNNWQECLLELSDNASTTSDWFNEFNEAKTQFGSTIKNGPVAFPSPVPWT